MDIGEYAEHPFGFPTEAAGRPGAVPGYTARYTR
jgi:hypothetical protein